MLQPAGRPVAPSSKPVRSGLPLSGLSAESSGSAPAFPDGPDRIPAIRTILPVLLAGLLGASWLFGPDAGIVRAECVPRKGDVVVRDATTDAVLETLAGGEFLECSDPSGTSVTFTLAGHLPLRLTVCLANCPKDVEQGLEYLSLGDGLPRQPDKEFDAADGLTCRELKGYGRKYCWEEHP